MPGEKRFLYEDEKIPDEIMKNINWDKLVRVYLLANMLAGHSKFGIESKISNFIDWIGTKSSLYSLSTILRTLGYHYVKKDVSEEEKQIIEKIIKLLSE